MLEWADQVDKTCPKHEDRHMIVDNYFDGTPRREGRRVKVKCPITTCDEVGTVTAADARSDIA